MNTSIAKISRSLATILCFMTFGASWLEAANSPRNDASVMASVQQKTITVSGVVVDQAGEPLPGVYVSIVGTKKGTSTDLDGKYSLECMEGQKLLFSYMGFKNREMTFGGSLNSFKKVVLEEDAVALEGVAVIGYGNTQKIKDVTGSISHVGSKEIAQASMGSNISSVLQGKAAGVNVQIQSASPTSPVSVVIRGQSSLSGNNQPLWIIDGIPEYNTGLDGSVANVLYSLNLNDVESVDILKDASSTAIYGSRAANGVIVVTTKSGKEGMKPTLEVSGKVGMQVMDFNGYDLMNGNEYIAFTRASTRAQVMRTGTMGYFPKLRLDLDSFYALNSSEFNADRLVDLDGAYYDANNNWLDMMTQSPINQQYDLTLRGGTKAVSYLASASYNDVQGVVKSGYSRMFSGRLRLEARISDALKLRVNASGSTRNASDKDYMIKTLKEMRSDMPAFNEDGSIFTLDEYSENPYTTLKNKQYSTGENLAGNIELEWKIIKGLQIMTKFSINYANNESLNYYRRGSQHNTTGQRAWTHGKSDTKIWDNTLLYANTFGKHDLSASLTASMERYQGLHHGIDASKFPDDDVLNSFSDAAKVDGVSESYNANSMVSQIARIQYNYDSRYLATFTIRHDGSSRFGKDNRWGWFPSGGLGWTITNEPFVKDTKFNEIVTFLKIRASYGKSGSQNLGDYDWLTLVGSNQYNEIPGMYPSKIGNTRLQWEESYMTDIALEMEFWKSRIRASVGYYNKHADNLIYSEGIPISSSFQELTSNMASTKANGVEFNIEVDAIKNSKWQLTFNANGSTNKSRILKFNNTLKELRPEYSIVPEGGVIGNWYGWETNRLFGSSEEVAALKKRNESGKILDYRADMEAAGDLYIKDQNGDKAIDEKDCKILGSAMPKLFGGFGVQLYMGTNLNIGATFTYSIGNKRLWYEPMNESYGANIFNQSNKIAGKSAIVQSPYDLSTMPNITPSGVGKNHWGWAGGTVVPDYWLYDGSYLRLSSLNASYRLDKSHFKNSIVDNLEFTFQANNLFTVTRYPGFDPQGNFNTSDTGMTGTVGVDYSFYPAARTFTLGVKLTFR